MSEEEAEQAILGYLVMASLSDSSFRTPLREPATPQERNMPAVYGRWADGFNVVNPTPTPLATQDIRGRTMRLSLDGYGEVVANSDDYLLLAPRILSFLSGQITLFPGDVITLGRVGEQLTIPADQRLPASAMLHATIDGIGTLASPLLDGRE